jgi:hypothetical protein
MRQLDRLDAVTRDVVERLADSARAEGLPIAPLVGKALEGASKGASGPRIQRAVRELAAALRSSRGALGSGASEAELVAGASALLSGADAESLRRIRMARRAAPVTVPLVVLADLIVRGVPAAAAVDAVAHVAAAAASDADFMLLRRNVEQDILAGAAPASAAALRAAAMAGERTREPPRSDRPPSQRPPGTELPPPD